MIYYVGAEPHSSDLCHYGIKGQKWGVRRYQNEDGTLTNAGKARYGTAENFNNKMSLFTKKLLYFLFFFLTKNNNIHSFQQSIAYSKWYNRAADPFRNITKKQRAKTDDLQDKMLDSMKNAEEAKAKYRESNNSREVRNVRDPYRKARKARAARTARQASRVMAMTISSIGTVSSIAVAASPTTSRGEKVALGVMAGINAGNIVYNAKSFKAERSKKS